MAEVKVNPGAQPVQTSFLQERQFNVLHKEHVLFAGINSYNGPHEVQAVTFDNEQLPLHSVEQRVQIPVCDSTLLSGHVPHFLVTGSQVKQVGEHPADTADTQVPLAETN